MRKMKLLRQRKRLTRSIRIVSIAARLLTAIIIAFTLVGPLSAEVKAAENPVDLELGGEGATPWSIGDIVPGDNGTTVVELRNVGSRDGFVTIWISDIVSYEGLTPESETGNTAEPGELNTRLLFNISSNRTSSTLNLPATIDSLPQSFSDPNSIEILPLKVGDVVDLQWDWELPVGTVNDVQGDAISFTITYLLTEFEIIDVSGVVEETTGTFTDNVTVESEAGGSTVSIEEGTVGETEEGDTISELWFIKIDKEPAMPSDDTAGVGDQYEAGPHGSTFDQPVTITLHYESGDIPERASEEDLTIATWDENTADWIELSGSLVDTDNKTVTGQVNHFSRYTILVDVPPPPPPPPAPDGGPATEGEEESPPAAPTDKEDIVTPPVLKTIIVGEERTVTIEDDGTLLGSLSLADPEGRFVIEVDSGSRIVSKDGEPLTRIEVTKVEQPAPLPDDTVTLSSIYKVTGYIDESVLPVINFEPSARITILYDPRDLPENAFPPYITNYTEQGGWVPLEAPPDSFFEIGKAKALIYHASWFAAVAELALPPPPLPADFKVSNLTINPERSEVGEPVIITLSIANDGAVTGSYELYLIIDGIVRAVKEVTLDGKTVETVSFEVSNLAAGKHQVRIAGLTGEFQIIRTTIVLPDEATTGWIITEVSIAIVIITLLVSIFLIIRRSRKVQQARFDPDAVANILRRRDEDDNSEPQIKDE